MPGITHARRASAVSRVKRSRNPSTETTSTVPSPAPPKAESNEYWRRPIRSGTTVMGTSSRSPPVRFLSKKGSPSLVRPITQTSTGRPASNSRKRPAGMLREDSRRPREPNSRATLSVVYAWATGSGVTHTRSTWSPFPSRSWTTITVDFLGASVTVSLLAASAPCRMKRRGSRTTIVWVSGSISSSISP